MSEKIEQITFEFEPKKTIKGYPELHWTGKRPYKSTVYYPAQLKEVYGDSVPFTDKDGNTTNWLNKIFWGDNLQVMSHLLKDYRGKIDLIYIDPPFDSKADYKKKIKLKGKEVSNDQSAFEEKQYGDIWTNDEYLQFMYERLIVLRELLSASGAIYIHCDWHKSAQLKCICDSIFGPENFRNEIVWCYRTSLRSSGNSFGRDHDNILFYSKTNMHVIHPDRKDFPVSEETLKRWAAYADENGFVSNKYFAGSASTIIDTSDETKGFYINHGIPRDWWEISANVAKGNTLEVVAGKYPTQKPESLLERIIKASSNPGDLVFDCFMGSGTTQAVAMKLGRRFIGADINLGAVQTTTKRLLKIAENYTDNLLENETIYKGFEVYNVNNYEIFRNPIEARSILLQALEVEPFESSSVYDGEKDGRMVKIIPADVNRIATKADLKGFIATLPYKTFERRKEENPNEPVLKLTVVCMGHEPDLGAELKKSLSNYKVDIEIVDILTDRKDLQFKRDAQGDAVIENGQLVIKNFYPLNLMQKLSMQRDNVDEWRQLVESVMVDFNYDGAVFSPTENDVPDKNELVKGIYPIPENAGRIKIKITDLLSESLELELEVK